jgi:ribosome-binding protein aMBF1 (putative translation factor)
LFSLSKEDHTPETGTTRAITEGMTGGDAAPVDEIMTGDPTHNGDSTVSSAQLMVKLLGKAVAKQRASLSMSQEQLSTISGLHRTYISDIERGCRSLSFKNVCRLAWALNLEPSSLMAMAERLNDA